MRRRLLEDAGKCCSTSSKETRQLPYSIPRTQDASGGLKGGGGMGRGPISDSCNTTPGYKGALSPLGASPIPGSPKWVTLSALMEPQVWGTEQGILAPSQDPLS